MDVKKFQLSKQDILLSFIKQVYNEQSKKEFIINIVTEYFVHV
jgi:hypothetical protein